MVFNGNFQRINTFACYRLINRLWLRFGEYNVNFYIGNCHLSLLGTFFYRSDKYFVYNYIFMIYFRKDKESNGNVDSSTQELNSKVEYGVFQL